jgi:tRNA dimethylallyltransferase
MRAVGYRQAWQHLDGEFGAGEFRDRAIFATRQLARRQLTWLRGERDARALDPFVPDHLRQAIRAVRAFAG